MAALIYLLGQGASSAVAAAPSPGWAIKSVGLPSNFSTGDSEGCEARAECDIYMVTATNVGTRASEEGGRIVVKDGLPTGVVARNVHAAFEVEAGSSKPMECPGRKEIEELAASVECSFTGSVGAGDVLVLTVEVMVTSKGAASRVTNHAEVEGGGAAPAATSEPSTVATTVNGEASPFGVQGFGVEVHSPNGAGDAQAGDHPGTLTTTIDYVTELRPGAEFGRRYVAVQEPKTAIVDLPLGFVGNPLAAGQCPESGLVGSREMPGRCPADSRVGIAAIKHAGEATLVNIYNVVPEAGYPAEFGFEFNEAVILMRARAVPRASGYTLSVAVPDIPRSQQLKVTGVSLTFFGDPAEQNGGASLPAAFFTNPTNCQQGPLSASVEMDSWVNPDRWVSNETTMYEASPSQAVSGCNMLQFTPTIELAPETLSTTPPSAQADSPAGYEVNLKVPQEPNVFPALATPELKNAEVTLPEGVSISPSAADGLVGCKEAGPEGINITHGWTPTGLQPLDPADPEAMEIGPDGLPHVAAGHCPAGSTLGTVEIVTPLLASPLHGHVYLPQPQCGAQGQPPCGEDSATNGALYGLYLEAAGSGVIVKLKGKVSADPKTGRLTAKFEENPQLPFSELVLKLTGGPRAPLANPQSCGEVRTTSVMTPWSAPESGPSATPFSAFEVSGCASPMPLVPGFLAQTTTPNAGAFSPFTLTISRHDGEQNLSGITVGTPPGLLGKISEVQLCPEPQASQGTCGPQSLIGHAQVAAGAGSHPFWVSGTVFLTGPYKGQPFGLSIVTPANAGPFNLGNVIVRAAIHVDPHTSALTVASDPLPQIIDGVPLRIKTVNVTVDKPGFMFNPTNCSQQQITGTITGALPNGSPGSTAAVASPFAASGCKNLPFKPKFTVLTQAKTSKANGAYLHVKVASGPGQANIGKVKVDLPQQLPSRLTTLQKACIAAVFETNPATCPAGSVVGTGTAVTPVLKNILTGPAYLVSHGGAAFPDLEIVLQGEGITLDLVGNTDIKKGITSSTFKSVPDAPISTFDLVLTEGPHSALAAYGNLCKSTLNMPTALTGQNGAVIKQTTKIAVSGCPKAKKATLSRAQKLAEALKACKKKPKSERAACEARARKQYAVNHKATSKKK